MNLLSTPWLRRLTIAKSSGFTFGLAGFLLVGALWPEEPLSLRIGILFWYTTLGGIIGLMGVIDRHPAFPRWRLPWWVRGPMMGAWMNLLLVLLLHDKLAAMMEQFMAPNPPFENPLWVVLEGALLGLLIDWLATHFAGDGPELLSPAGRGQRFENTGGGNG